MSGGTPTQNAVLLTLLALLVGGGVVVVVLGRFRRARATGSREAGSVRSRAHAKEIADRLYSFCSRHEGSGPDGEGTDRTRVRVRGAARLLRVLSTDSRFDVTPRGTGEYWSFAVRSSGGPEGSAASAPGQGMVEILSRNGVTAVAGDEAE